jgi:hypothetical protein
MNLEDGGSIVSKSSVNLYQTIRIISQEILLFMITAVIVLVPSYRYGIQVLVLREECRLTLREPERKEAT